MAIAVWQVLLSAIRVDAGHDGRLREHLERAVEWPALYHLADRHGVLPLVYTSLEQAGEDLIPPLELDRFRVAYRENAFRNLRLTHKLLVVLDLLGRHGIDAIPFKGPSLAVDAYGDLTLRQFVDLDLLIDGRNLDAACELLPSIGFHPSMALDSKRRRRLRMTARELAFSDGLDLLEIQWAVAERFLLTAREDAELRRPTRTLNVRGTSVRAVSEDAVLLFLCFHGAKHGWRELKWTADVAYFVSSHPGLDWDNLWSTARRHGHARILALGLGLAVDLFGLALPARVVSAVRGDRAAAKLAAQATSLFLGPGRVPGVLETWARFIRSRERWRDRIRCTLDLAVTPKPGDWLGLDLPRPLYPLYYVIRPFRLVAAARHRPAPRA